MKENYRIAGSKILLVILLSGVTGMTSFAQTSFTSSDLKNATLGSPTSLQFGPDGKLYIVQQDGTIRILTIKRNKANDYEVTDTETLSQIRLLQNYNDDGTPFNPSYQKRQCTGILVKGTAANPIIYVSSSDYRIGAGETKDGNVNDVNLCTNSGVISKLYKEGSNWKKVDLVRGMPRSEENHAPNGMQMYGNTLLISIGGTTNAGGPSRLWTYVTEYALSAAILSIDLSVIENMPDKTDSRTGDIYKYDIPTLDDPTRSNNPNGTDVGDPWGGNDGMNQAKIVAGGPVQIFSGGWRNAYDILISMHPGRTGNVYTVDNGPNGNWGGYPAHDGIGTATNEYPEGEPGSGTVGNYDGFEFIGNMNTYVPGSYYGGHPVPVRANRNAGLYSDNGTHRGWRNNNSNPNLPLPSDWPPVPNNMINPAEGEYHNPGTALDKSIIYWDTSINGFCEYLYSGNEFYGDLFVTAFDNPANIYRIDMDDNHQVITNMSAQRMNLENPIFSGFGSKPLDIVAQADGEIFEGTIWVATWGSHKITVFEPQTLSSCTGAYSKLLDEDNDGYTNADEIDNSTFPCSASSKPGDFDTDGVSDLNDNDDDNDGILDTQDLFALDADNGTTTQLPTHYHLFNYDPGTGFFGVGFTGLMCNGTTDYIAQFDPNRMISGGAAGVVTVEEVPEGDAHQDLNNQEYAFQFGILAGQNTGIFTLKSGIMPQYFNKETPIDNQSQGIYIGTGDQDNYIKIALHSNDGVGGIEVVKEDNGSTTSSISPLPQGIQTDPKGMPTQAVIFYLIVDPDSRTVYPKFSIGGNIFSAGLPLTLSGNLKDAIIKNNVAVAVGIIATSRSSGKMFNATWDFIEVYEGDDITSTKKIVNAEENINIFPNPGSDKVTININSLVAQNYNIRIFNSLGQEVQNINVSHNPSIKDYEIDINNLNSGIYYLHFISEKEERSATVKLIKR